MQSTQSDPTDGTAVSLRRELGTVDIPSLCLGTQMGTRDGWILSPDLERVAYHFGPTE
jgi:hypothetical protein